MSPIVFYREQAAQQQLAADAAALQNVRERCQRASDAWTALAERSEKSQTFRDTIATSRAATLAEQA
ncbi:MAG: hypothetical protein RQ833_02980 [Sphingomonadaceae bacterium]|nr:hypothetical protein [Sphingomonadaceae bacterium]